MAFGSLFRLQTRRQGPAVEIGQRTAQGCSALLAAGGGRAGPVAARNSSEAGTWPRRTSAALFPYTLLASAAVGV